VAAGRTRGRTLLRRLHRNHPVVVVVQPDHGDLTRPSLGRTSYVGRLDKALDEATARQWVVVEMKQNWKVIYPFQK
jgi:hypothetical protein